MKLSSALAVATLAAQVAGAALSHKVSGRTITEHPDPVKRALLQKYVCGIQTFNSPVLCSSADNDVLL